MPSGRTSSSPCTSCPARRGHTSSETGCSHQGTHTFPAFPGCSSVQQPPRDAACTPPTGHHTWVAVEALLRTVPLASVVDTSWLAAIRHTFVKVACRGIACLAWRLEVTNQIAGSRSRQLGQAASLEATRLLVGCILAGFVGLPYGSSVVAVAAACCRSGLLAEPGEVAYLPPIGHLAIHWLLLTELPKEVVEGIHFGHLQNLDAKVVFTDISKMNTNYKMGRNRYDTEKRVKVCMTCHTIALGLLWWGCRTGNLTIPTRTRVIKLGCLLVRCPNIHSTPVWIQRRRLLRLL